MRDSNINPRQTGRLKARPDWVNWRSLRASHATRLKVAGADVKDAQVRMRQSRASTTLDIYQRFAQMIRTEDRSRFRAGSGGQLGVTFE